jgi:hypothetical protein
MTKKTTWKGDIVVRGCIPRDKVKRFYGVSDLEASQMISGQEESQHLVPDMRFAIKVYSKSGDLNCYMAEQYCGHTPTQAADTIRRFLAVGVIPEIKATDSSGITWELIYKKGHIDW